MGKQAQSFSNHGRYSPLYHFFLLPAGLALLVGSIYYSCTTAPENFLLSILLIGMSFTMLMVSLNSRIASLKSQDRAIRAEENLRYFMLAGKRMDPKVNMRQIIALRFASDEELVALTEKVVQENLRAKVIKQQIKSWKGDHYRV